MEELTFKKILISRTDNIGDVILTLPMAGVLKNKYPNSKIFFLGKKYTKSVIEACSHIDKFYDWDEIKNSENKTQIFTDMGCDVIIHVFPNKEIATAAKRAKIKIRIGTNRRLFHWIYCNNNVNLTRKNSSLHESQLNLKLLNRLNIRDDFKLSEIYQFYGFHNLPKLPEKFISLIDPDKFNIILHPKSKGSAREWGIENFVTLANSLPKEKFKVFFSGGQEESQYIKEKIIPKCPDCHDISGLFSLNEFILFINSCDGFIANSTGPLHIASALGKHTIGLYPPLPSMSPHRWAPIGKNVQFFLGKNTNSNKYCSSPCNINERCSCMENINPNTLLECIEKWNKNSDG
ncbi:glycosyltransferase family 9 protein [Silvanigrella aquatica]|uniref:Glycosyl transferase family 9 n=1 Tax=Silvanigrella aquatica TaxID=1915309 RepID=A0A1L4D3W6_9BACT|nr:glycosyltransferase family 9 protein [Silvanigrella aquatica]APJ04867.1 hypothetical protein AXG55_13585 [Silvanigrella aquatica]